MKSMYDYSEVPEVVEDGKTFAENARKKAKEVGDFLGQTVLADDSGLCVDKLEGAPGVYSARYAGEGASDEDNNAKLLSELEHMRLGEDTEQPLLSTARFVCHLALYNPATGSLQRLLERWRAGLHQSRPEKADSDMTRCFICRSTRRPLPS